MELRKKIKEFNKSKDPKIYIEIMEIFFKDRNKCRECGEEILFGNTKIGIGKNGIPKIYGPSFNSTKIHGDKLEVCEKCISDKFPEYNKLNKSRIFNTLNKITKWAFKIKDENLYSCSISELKLIKKYGEEEGKIRWDNYRKKQALSNSYKYKKKKYNWTRKKFKEFNKSRGITIKNLVKKYGAEDGERRFNNYIQKQKFTKSQDYMISKFGLEKTKEINKSKRITIENFIKKYGETEGKRRFDNLINKKSLYFSKISQTFFNLIDEKISKKYSTYYATKNGEFGVLTSIGYMKLDYYIDELKLAIEFNGNIFHANPKIFEENDFPNPFNKSLSAKEIWEKDKIRYETLLKEHNIKTIVVWEDEYKNFNIKNLKNYGILF